MEFKIQLFILLLLITKISSFIGYCKFQITCGNDYPDYIISSQGNIPPINQNKNEHSNRDYHYVFKFNDITHNFDQEICVRFVNLAGIGGFAFKTFSINEYDISLIKYENYFHCDNCKENVANKFTTTSTCVDKPLISGGRTSVMTFCLNSTNNISNFYIDENKIISNFYKGNTLQFLFNNLTNNFDIDNLFSINGNNNFIFYKDLVSFKIINITNIDKGKILNGDNEELTKDSFFNSRNNYLTHNKTSNEGYIMEITIETKPKNINSSISSSEIKAKIYLYVFQQNCTMINKTNDFCQICNPDYGKYIIENKCYHKSEKINNFYYVESIQIWKECETNKNDFTCSICPKGTYIKISDLQICEKCPPGEYASNEDQNNCEKCQQGFFSNNFGAIDCEKCPEGYTSLPGANSCFKICQAGYYPKEDICIPCPPGFYSPSSSNICFECTPGTYTDKEGMEKCLKCELGTFNNEYKQTNCFKCPINYYSDEKGLTSCKKYEEDKFSLEGYSSCKLCDKIISHCDSCSKDGNCLKCNNFAINGFNNCSVCENDIDWYFTGEYCNFKSKFCPKYFYKDKMNNNKIVCIKNILECPKGMDYLNLDTGECKENAKIKDFTN